MAVVKLKNQQVVAEPAQIDRSLDDLQARLQKNNLFSDPIDVYKVAEFLGLEIEYEVMEDDISGYLEFKDGRWTVGVNRFHHRNRQRFTIAHEIAHYILHRASQETFVDTTFARRAGSGTDMEREADKFAAEFLMPSGAVTALIEAGNRSLQELADEFCVSSLAMKYRVQSLGYTVK